MIILGLNIFHGDSSACIIKDGVVLSAVEEERFTRKKHWAGFPLNSINFCLKENNFNFQDIDHICVNQNNFSNILRKLFYVGVNKVNLKYILNKIKKRKLRNLRNLFEINFQKSGFKGKYHYIEHHLAHTSSAFYLSPFSESINVSIDGFGDFVSTAWGLGKNFDNSIDNKIYFPHSLGIFYQSLTQFLGFQNYGDEYKVMGLAPYGNNYLKNEFDEIVVPDKSGKFKLNLDYFRHHKSNIEFKWDDGMPIFDQIYDDKIESLFGKKREKSSTLEKKHFDIAYSTQKKYEEIFFNLLDNIYKKTPCENLTISGGCAMNSVANGKIKERTKFKNVFTLSSPGDAGGAIGSALYVHNNLVRKKIDINDSPYLGPSFSNEYVEKIIEDKIKNKNEFEIIKMSTMESIKFVAKKISEGNVIGWFQDKMEFGPRALGNRSILCDPRNSNMQATLNLKIKRRESFRPFAPSILLEKVNEWFENPSIVPYMSEVLNIKKDKQKEIPAVTHVDGTGRLQTVTREMNKKYYELILEFSKITNIPIILNTSFNEQEPIVCKPEEALDCFLRTKMDILCIENYLIIRK